MPAHPAHPTRSGLLAGVRRVAFALAAAVALASALLPDVPAPVDLQRTLLPAPSGRWNADAASSGPLDERGLTERGASPEAGRQFAEEVRGYARVWLEATHARAAQASIFQTSTPTSGGRFLAGMAEGLRSQGARTFPVERVDDALGFVFREPTHGLVSTQIAFRRGRLVFLVGVLAADPQPALARSLAVIQARRAPAGESGTYDEPEAMGLLVGSVIGALAIYLAIVNGRAGFRRRRARVRTTDRASGGEIEYRDVSGDVRLRRRIERAAFTSKCVGAAAALPLFGPAFWPHSLLLGVPGIALVICAFGLERGWRLATVGLLAFAVLLALSVVGIPLAVIIIRGALPVLRGYARPVATGSRRSRYRRLFTGRRISRVAGLLAVAAVLTTVGLFALVTGALAAAQGTTPSRQLLSALACLGLAVVPYRRARRHAAPEAASVTSHDARAPVLYLRSFGDDRLKVRARGGAGRHSSLERFGSRRRQRFEEVIAGCLWARGPVIAVGEPGERLAPLGGARMNFTDASWQAGVETWLDRAGLIVITVGRSAGLAWELSRVAEHQLWDRTILLFPPLPVAELADRWRYLATVANAELPAEIDLTSALAATAADGGFVAYEGMERDEWHYESALNDAARALLSQQRDVPVAA
jgi:hypothetical protein